MIAAGLWDDPDYVDLPTQTQLLWLYILTGPEAQAGCPGLVRTSIAALSEAMRIDSATVAAGLDQLSRLGWIVEDRRCRVVRVPKAPEYRKDVVATLDRPLIPVKALYAWFRKWTTVPDCQLKYDHIASVRAVFPTAEKAWAETFASVTIPSRFSFSARKQKQDTTTQLPLPVYFSEKVGVEAISTDKGQCREQERDRNREGEAARARAHTERDDEGTGVIIPLRQPPPAQPDVPVAPASAPAPPDAPADPPPAAASGPPVARSALPAGEAPRGGTTGPPARAAPQSAATGPPRESPLGPPPPPACARLWEKLQAHRAAVGLHRLEADPGDLARVQQLLPPQGGYTEAQLEHALDAALLQVREQGSPRAFLLNGRDGFHPNVLTRLIAAPTQPMKAAARDNRVGWMPPSNREAFRGKGGFREIPRGRRQAETNP